MTGMTTETKRLTVLEGLLVAGATLLFIIAPVLMLVWGANSSR